MSALSDRVLVVTPTADFAANLQYALAALEPNLEVKHVPTAALAMDFLARTDQSAPFLVMAHSDIADRPASTFLADVARRYAQIVRVLTADLPPVEARTAVLSACLHAGLFAFVPQPWLFENLGHLLDSARMRHAGQPARLTSPHLRQARFWTDALVK